MQLDLRLAVRQSYSLLRKRGHSSPPTPLQLDYARRIAESKRVVTAAPSVIASRPIRVGKLPSSLICSGYMYLYIACMIFNRLMSAMSIDGIWQNNLIYFEIRRNAASRFGIRIPYPCWLTAFSHSSPYTHWPATAGSFPVHVLSLVLYSYSQCLQSEQLVL